jgi:hypothetical protein
MPNHVIEQTCRQVSYAILPLRSALTCIGSISTLCINANTLATSATATVGLSVYQQTSVVTSKPSTRCARTSAARLRIAVAPLDGEIISCGTCKESMALRTSIKHRLRAQQAPVCKVPRSMCYTRGRHSATAAIYAIDRLLLRQTGLLPTFQITASTNRQVFFAGLTDSYNTNLSSQH